MDSEDINNRLQWYLKSYDDKKEQKCNDEKVDIIKQLSEIETFLKEKELYVCIRKLKCNCKNKNLCICDDDNEIKITSIKCEMGSNCSYIIELYYDSYNIRLPKNMILRFFYFDKNNNEIVAFDIVQSKVNTNIIFNFTTPNLTYCITDNLILGKGYISFTFNYLNYNL